MSIMSIVNRLLPFATPGTPLIQDVLHLTALCALLYYGPRIQEWLQSNRRQDDDHVEPAEIHPVGNDDLGPIQADGEQMNNVDDPGDAPGHEALANDENAGLDHHQGAQLEDPQPGPADEQPRAANGLILPPRPPEPRAIGKKKQKSLARKDERRHLNEFLRAEGNAQRKKDARGAEEREAALAVEKERRRNAEKEIDARKAKEREVKREKEEADRKETARRTELILSVVKEELDSRRMCNLFEVAKQAGDDVDVEWVKKVLRTSGMIRRNGDTITMITSTDWAVRVTADDMMRVFRAATELGMGADDGSIPNEELAALLEDSLKQLDS